MTARKMKNGTYECDGCYCNRPFQLIDGVLSFIRTEDDESAENSEPEIS